MKGGNMELKTLNLHKIIQTLYYLSLGKKINYMKLIKLMFFADRYSLRSYGNPISYGVNRIFSRTFQ